MSSVIVNKTPIVRSIFGSALRDLSENSSFSMLDCSYILDVSNATFHGWMKGNNFPQSIRSLKKLQFLFPKTHTLMNRVMKDPRVSLSDSEWSNFTDRIEYEEKSSEEDCRMNKRFKYRRLNDERDIRYRKIFSDYLHHARKSRGISIRSLCDALGVDTAAYYSWESGVSFPSNICLLGYLDRLYGDTFRTIFSVCSNFGIDLLKSEKKLMSKRMDSLGGDKKPKGYLNHHADIFRNSKIYREKNRELRGKDWSPKVPLKLTIEEMRAIAKGRGGKCLSKKYTNSQTKLKWKCGEGHVWESTSNNVKRGSWCPICARKKRKR